MTDLLPIEVVPLDSLTPHPRNYRSHPEEQLRHLAESLRVNGWNRNVIIARDGTILAGHGIVQAARQIGLETAPAVRVDLSPDDPRALKILAGDNELHRQAVDDDAALLAILREVAAEDVSGLLGTGFDDALLSALAQAVRREADDWEDEESEGKYTAKAESPIYTPTGEEVSLADCVDLTRYRALLEALTSQPDLPGEVFDFLSLAATRHVRFHYGKIAEYYAAAPPAIQALMEDSALVIIDYDRAIELGYVRLVGGMAELREAARLADGGS